MKKEIFKITYGAILLAFLFCSYIFYIGYDKLAFLILVVSIGSLFLFKFHVYKWMLFTLLFLLVFDNPMFLYTPLNLRLWYFLVLPLAVIFILLNKRKKKLGLEFAVISFLVIFACIYALNDGMVGVLFYIKYLIYILGIYVIYNLVLRNSLIFVMNSFIFIVLFVSVVGFIQFYFNIHGNFVLMDAPDLRPRAFFSETTWYGTLMVFGVISLIPLVRISKYYQLLYPFFLLGMLLSVSRNPFLALFLVLLLLFFLKIRSFKVKSLASIVIASFIIIALLIFFKDDIPLLGLFEEKFLRVGDVSASGRMDAFYQSFNLIKEHFFVGLGFLGSSTIVGSGTTIGSKSFSLFLMIFHILGVCGFIAFVLLSVHFYLKCFIVYFKSHDYFRVLPILFMTAFLGMASFAPLAQFSLCPMVLGIVIGTYLKCSDSLWKKRGKNEVRV